MQEREHLLAGVSETVTSVRFLPRSEQHQTCTARLATWSLVDKVVIQLSLAVGSLRSDWHPLMRVRASHPPPFPQQLSCIQPVHYVWVWVSAASRQILYIWFPLAGSSLHWCSLRGSRLCLAWASIFGLLGCVTLALRGSFRYYMVWLSSLGLMFLCSWRLAYQLRRITYRCGTCGAFSWWRWTRLLHCDEVFDGRAFCALSNFGC